MLVIVQFSPPCCLVLRGSELSLKNGWVCTPSKLVFGGQPIPNHVFFSGVSYSSLYWTYLSYWYKNSYSSSFFSQLKSICFGNLLSMGFILWFIILHSRPLFKTRMVGFTSLITQCTSRPISAIDFPVRNSKKVLRLKFVGRETFCRINLDNFKVSRWNTKWSFGVKL